MRRLPRFPKIKLIYREKAFDREFFWTLSSGGRYSGNSCLFVALLDLLLDAIPTYFITYLIPYIKCRFWDRHTSHLHDSNGVMVCSACLLFLGWASPHYKEGDRWEWLPGETEPGLAHFASGWGYELNPPEWRIAYEQKVKDIGGYV